MLKYPNPNMRQSLSFLVLTTVAKCSISDNAIQEDY